MTQRLGISNTDKARSDQVSGLPFYSPVTHGMLQVDVVLENDTIIKASPVLGSMHRGAEKLFESRDYRQIMMLANRHEWLSAFSGELGVAQLLERALGIEVPLAARWIRTILLEINRITSHLAFLAGFPHHNHHLVQALRDWREEWVKLTRTYTGSRMHPMLNRIGGLHSAPSSEWLVALHGLATDGLSLHDEHAEALINCVNSYVKIGVLSLEDAQEYCLSGPVARATGYHLDFRTHAHELNYQTIDFAPISHGLTNDTSKSTFSDVSTRMLQLWFEVRQSLEIIQALLASSNMDSSDINVLLPKVVRVPEGEYAHQIETPLGIASWFLVSRGDKMPYRLKLRPASLHTVLALPRVLSDEKHMHFDAIVASMPFVAGDIDR